MMLYIHIPFCKGKCIYCNFYSGGNPDWKTYIKALLNELTLRGGEIQESLESVYIGGGTPSLMPPEDFAFLISEIKNLLGNFWPEFPKKNEIEFTIEINPEDVSEDKIKIWKNAGVNRVSMGVQTLVDEELEFLKRRHDSEGAIRSGKLLREHFENVSLDIMYGIPGQTTESLEKTLSALIDLQPDHLSAYSLTYEDGTPLALFRKQKRFPVISEEESNRMRELIDKRFKEAGFERYEISNYARQGKRSRHNSGYWQGKAYLGLGPAAASFDGKTIRRTNPENLKAYLSFFSAEPSSSNSLNINKFYEEEKLTLRNKTTEKIFLRLRTKEGINLKEYKEEFGELELNRLLNEAKKWVKRGELCLNDSHLAVTEKGIPVSDYIFLHLMPY